MRIAIWSEAFAPSLGGLERFSQVLARWLTMRGHEVVVLTRTPANSASDASEPYAIRRVPTISQSHRALQRADLVHVAGASMKGVALALSSGSRVVVTHAGPQLVCPSGLAWSELGNCSAGPTPGPCDRCDRRGVGAWMDVRTRRQVMRRTATNVFVSRYLRSRCGVPGTVIYNPVPDNTFVDRGRTAPSRDLIVGAGRFVLEKGFDLLVRAMRQIDARLVLAGDGPLRPALESLAAGLGLEAKVVFRGRVTAAELRTLYAEATLTCVPSLWDEPFGYAVAEAMASGVAVVATPRGAIPELLADERGFLAASMTPEALATSIRLALTDEGDRSRRARRAVAFAREELQVDVIGRRYEELYGV